MLVLLIMSDVPYVDKGAAGGVDYDCQSRKNQGGELAAEKEPLTLSPREAAAMVPMGINQFYAAVREGVVPSLRIGNRIRIPRRKFIAWLDGDALP